MTPESFIAQQEFDEKYITSSEVCKLLDMSRPVLLHHRKKGKLPNEILLQNGQLVLWERKFIAPYLETLSQARNARRITAQ